MINQLENLRCPKTKQPLRLLDRNDAENIFGSKLVPLRIMLPSPDQVTVPHPIGVTQTVLVREDNGCAYPVIDNIGILLIPEMLGSIECQFELDLGETIYAEAYAEMDGYNKIATLESKEIEKSESYKTIEPILNQISEKAPSFPSPLETWIDAIYDCGAQLDAYSHIAPLQGKRILQIGGKGTHAIKFLLAGATEAWLLSPMIGELKCCQELGKIAKVNNNLHCVSGISEELPFEDEYFDAIYAGGCVHHMETPLAIPEICRVLRTGGKFSAVDPWLTPVYTIGKKLFGQREPAHCHPLTNERIQPFHKYFNEFIKIHHGAFLRYPLLLLNKLGFTISITTSMNLSRIDNWFSVIIPGFRNHMGGSVSLLCRK